MTAFAEQFATDVSIIDDAMRAAFLDATGPAAFSAVQAIYVDDFWPRVLAPSSGDRPPTSGKGGRAVAGSWRSSCARSPG